MSMDAATIRLASVADAEVISALFTQLGHPAGAEEVAARLERFAQAGEEALVAELDGEVVGVTALSVMRTLHRPTSVGRMSVLVVSEVVRGRGIGRALVAAAEARLAERGCALVEVTSNQQRVQAHAFYEGLGYQKTSFRFFKALGGTPYRDH
jgi:ribosomal protein S18 acetylase RimI-like enzyme